VKGYRFYEELENKGRKSEKSQGTVVAALLRECGRGWNFIYVPPMRRAGGGRFVGVVECISALFGEPNSPVCGGQTTDDYLWNSCRRISEKRAREVHPRLFEYLDS